MTSRGQPAGDAGMTGQPETGRLLAGPLLALLLSAVQQALEPVHVSVWLADRHR